MRAGRPGDRAGRGAPRSADALEALGVRFAVGDLHTGEGLDGGRAGRGRGAAPRRRHQGPDRGGLPPGQRRGDPPAGGGAGAAEAPAPPRVLLVAGGRGSRTVGQAPPRGRAARPGLRCTAGASSPASRPCASSPTACPRSSSGRRSSTARATSTNLPAADRDGQIGVYLKAGFGPEALLASSTWTICAQALIAAGERGKTLSREDPTEGVYFVSDPTAVQLGGLLHRPQPGARAGQAEGRLRPRGRRATPPGAGAELAEPAPAARSRS